MPVYDSQGHWDSAFPMDPNKYLGFIYLVTNLLNGEKYVGKKNYNCLLYTSPSPRDS